jgi:phage terminase large subunit
LEFDFVTNRHKLFNSLFYKIKKADSRFIMNYGGAGSGKSVAQHQLELLLQLDGNCNYDTLFVRKHATDIYDSCYSLLKSLAKKYHIEDNFNWTYSNAKRQIENKETGHRILFKGVDDPEKLKSIVGIKRIIIEEASQLDFNDFLELNRRARGIEGIQIIFLFNPININHWIKTKLIDSQSYSKNMTVFRTTYKDNRFLTDIDKEQLENLKEVDENHYNIYALGEWGVDDPDKLFAKAYNKNIHFKYTTKELYSPYDDVFLSWDFNIQNTCLAIQNPTHSPDTINVLREYHFKGYDLQMLCEMIYEDWKGHELFINGDASGRAQSALTSGNESAYDMLRSLLNLSYERHFFVPAANPSHLNSRILTNLLFKHYTINISTECVELHNDLLAVEVDDRGSMDTYKKKNPERTHHLDPLRYHFNAHHRDKISLLNIKNE